MSAPVSLAAVRILVNSPRISTRRPLRAKERSCFHHGSIKFSQQAYLGMNWIRISGQAASASLV